MRQAKKAQKHRQNFERHVPEGTPNFGSRNKRKPHGYLRCGWALASRRTLHNTTTGIKQERREAQKASRRKKVIESEIENQLKSQLNVSALVGVDRGYAFLCVHRGRR